MNERSSRGQCEIDVGRLRRCHAARRAAAILAELQVLRQQGGDDSPGSDRLRSEFEDLWDQHSPLDRELLNGLSADLYWLSGEELLLASSDAPAAAKASPTADDLVEIAGLLHSLRSRPPDSQGSAVAVLRGLAYAALGYDHAARLFLEAGRRACRHSLAPWLDLGSLAGEACPPRFGVDWQPAPRGRSSRIYTIRAPDWPDLQVDLSATPTSAVRLVRQPRLRPGANVHIRRT